jgi:hypothetical protein
VSVVWRPAPYWKPLGACRFRYDNPSPQPECSCGIDWDDVCTCCTECACEAAEWEQIIECRRPSLVLVQLTEGAGEAHCAPEARAGYFECCSPEAHGLEVLWWAPLIGPRRQAQHLVDVHRIMKFVYSDERIEALAALSNPWADPGR